MIIVNTVTCTCVHTLVFYPPLDSDLFIMLSPMSDLRREMTQFYQSFSSPASATNSDFEPVFLTPYYDLFGLGRRTWGERVKKKSRERKREKERGKEGEREHNII